MLIILIVWIYATFLFWSFGLIYQRIIEKVFSEEKNISPYLTLWNGILFITVILSVISLFSKITYILSLVFLVCSLLYIIVDFNYVKDKFKTLIYSLKSISPFIYLVFLLFFTLTLCQASSSSIITDTVGYHHQNVKWINNYSVVPGLGNLHDRLAFNSHWFLLSAMFNYNDYDFHFVSGLVILFGFFWGLTGVNELLKKRFVLINMIKALSIPLVLIFNIDLANSLSTDLPTFFIIYFILFYAVQLLEKKENNIVLIFMLINFSIFLVTVKLSSLFISILPLYLLYHFLRRSNIRFKSISFVFISSLIIIIPFLIRNIIQSGYLVFPFPALDLFNFDWKIPYDRVNSTKDAIEFWAKKPGAGFMEVANNDFWFWFIPWLKDNTLWLVNRKRPELLLFFMSIITYIAYFFFHSNKAKNHLKKFSIIYITLLINLTIWFINGPDVRFASGYLFFFSVLLFSLQDWNWIIKIRESVYAMQFARVVLILLVCSLLFRTDISKLTTPKNWTTLSPYPRVELRTKRILNSQVIYIPKGRYEGSCFNIPLPCTPYFDPLLEIRGKSLQDGFKAKDGKWRLHK